MGFSQKILVNSHKTAELPLFLSFCPLTRVVSSGGDVAPRNVLICPHLQMNRGGRKRRRRRGFELSPFPLPCPSFSLPLTPFVASMLFALARPPETKKKPSTNISMRVFHVAFSSLSFRGCCFLEADKSDRQRRGAKRKREICKISRSSSSRKTKVEQDGSHIQLFLQIRSAVRPLMHFFLPPICPAGLLLGETPKLFGAVARFFA